MRTLAILIVLSFGMVILSGFGSKLRSVSDVCESDKLQKLDQRFENALVALKPWRSDSIGAVGKKSAKRALASTADPELEFVGNLSKRDRESWRVWAEENLKETQQYIDIATAEPDQVQAKRDLSKVANELVAFHGFSVAGDTDRMIQSLQRIHQYNRNARKTVCTPLKKLAKKK